MKINFIKNAGGVLTPASDMDAERLTKFKTGEMYEVEIKRTRSPQFHRKVFAFFNFCFEHWEMPEGCIDEVGQMKVFRNHLTVLAGYYDSFHGIDGKIRIEAKSLSFGSMSQEEFEQFYNAAINAAMKNLFKAGDDEVYNRLVSFF